MADDKPQEKKSGGVKRWLKRIALALLALVLLAAVIGGIYVYVQTSAYDASMNKVYDIAPPPLARSNDPAVIARGKHLASSVAGCAIKDCHGPDLGAGKVTDIGPIGTMAAPNMTTLLPTYSDGELARLIRHGVKKDGRSVCFMGSQEINWIPDADIVAVISYVRTVPAVDRPNAGTTAMKPLGKILDRKGLIPADVARRIDHDHIEIAPAAAPTAEYGKFIGHLCSGCHGEQLSGGHIPGTPGDFPIPLNLTPDATGLKGWTYEDFERLAMTGNRKNGKPLDPFMPVEALKNMDDVEKHALWAYLQSLPPVAFGNR